MVAIGHAFSTATIGFILLAEQTPAAKTLPEPVRQIAYMALLGIALLGMLMIVATLLGGHWVRRWGSRIRRSSVPPDVIIRRTEQHSSPKLPDEAVGEGDTLGHSDDTIGS